MHLAHLLCYQNIWLIFLYQRDQLIILYKAVASVAASSELIVWPDLHGGILFLFSNIAAGFSYLFLSQHEACYCSWSRFTQGPLASVSYSRSPRRSCRRPSSTAWSGWVMSRWTFPMEFIYVIDKPLQFLIPFLYHSCSTVKINCGMLNNCIALAVAYTFTPSDITPLGFYQLCLRKARIFKLRDSWENLEQIPTVISGISQLLHPIFMKL